MQNKIPSKQNTSSEYHPQQYYIELNNDGSFNNKDNKIYYMNAFDSITLTLDSKIHQEFKPILLTSYPKLKDSQKIRFKNSPPIDSPKIIKQPLLSQQYTTFPGYFNQEYSWQCDILISDFTGSLFFQVVFVDYSNNVDEEIDIKKFASPEWFIINPHIKINQLRYQIQEINVQSLLPNQLKNFEEWELIIKQQSELGYNAFHLPPLCKLGAAQNFFSIFDFHSLNQNIFEFQNDSLTNQSFLKLRQFIQNMEQTYNVIFFIDIVLNKVSRDCEWIQSFPNAYYNINNSKFLKSALQLELSLQEFSKNFCAGAYAQQYHKVNLIENEDDINQVIKLVKEIVIDPLNLIEYFQLEMEYITQNLKQFFEKNKIILNNNDLTNTNNKTNIDKNNSIIQENENTNNNNIAKGRSMLNEKRRMNAKLYQKKQIQSPKDQNRKLNLQLQFESSDSEDDNWVLSKSPKRSDLIANQIFNACYNLGVDRKAVQIDYTSLKDLFQSNQNQSTFEDYLYYIGKTQKKLDIFFQHFQENMLYNLKSDITYKLQQNKINIFDDHAANPLFTPYFSKLSNNDFAANNGWVKFEKHKKQNIVESPHLHYLKRNLFIQPDSIKLRIADFHDCPQVWKILKKYVQQYAEIFHGFRIYNPHSTSHELIEYCIRKARNVNKNLLILAEPVQDDVLQQTQFIKKVGLNFVIEYMNDCSTSALLYEKLKNLSFNKNNIVGSLEPMYEIDLQTNFYKIILVPKNIDSIVYDQYIKQNQTTQNFGNQQALSLLALLSFSNFFNASTFGVDELFKQDNPNFQDQIKNVDFDNNFQKIISNSNNSLEKLITYYPDIQCNEVLLKGSWDNWQNQIRLTKKITLQNKLVFYCNLSLSKSTVYYEYKYIIDGNWNYDHKTHNNGNNNILQLKSYEANQSSAIFKNLRYPRQIFNKYSKKLSKKYKNTQLQFYQQFDVITITRESNCKTKNYFFITKCSFKPLHQDDISKKQNENVLQIICPGILQKVKYIMFIPLEQENLQNPDELSNKFCIFTWKNLEEYATIQKDLKTTILNFFYLPPGLTIVLKCQIDQEQIESVQYLNKFLFQYNQEKQQNHIILDSFNLSPQDLNYVLYSSLEEEINRNTIQTYEVPGKGCLNFAGFASLFFTITNTCINNDLEDPVYVNLRTGFWLLDYLLLRLQKRPQLQQLYLYTESIFQNIKKVPKYLIPYYFSKCMRTLRISFKQNIFNNLKQAKSLFSSNFHKNLIMAAYQYISDLPICLEYSEDQKAPISKIILSTSIPRNYQDLQNIFFRDIMMSFKGILLISGLHQEAKELLLYLSRFLKNGLMPNKISQQGQNPRYNARDTCWWYIKALNDYIDFTNDKSILKHEITMKYAQTIQIQEKSQEKGRNINNDQSQLQQTQCYTIIDIVQSIFQAHAKGINFIEDNYGISVDQHLDVSGFNINIQLDEKTGFLYGGNSKNALTWMNNIGSSKNANNFSFPSAIRDGSPIECVALLQHCLNIVLKLHNEGLYNYTSVICKSGNKLSFKKWSQNIMNNFHEKYWIPRNSPTRIDKYAPHQKETLEYRKDIYRDSLNSSSYYQEQMLRPNVCLAISLAPELFQSNSAMMNLAQIEYFLIKQNSLGVKSLDVIAQNYEDSFQQFNDSNKFKLANGFSQFNGPEHIFLYGYFLKSMIQINKHQPFFRNERLMSYLCLHKSYIKNNEWLSLPNLTNDDGSFCPDANPSSMLAIAQIIEVCYELLEHEKKLINLLHNQEK